MNENEKVTPVAEETAAEKPEVQEDFTVGLALLDAVPVVLFAASGIIIGMAASSPIVIAGAVLMVIGGMCKVIWKLLQGLKIGNYPVLNKAFVPCMASGFMSLVAGIVVAFVQKKLVVKTVLKSLGSFPSILFFGIAGGAMGMMGKVKSAQSRDDFNKDAKKNWLAEIVNSVAQLALFLALLFAKKKAADIEAEDAE